MTEERYVFVFGSNLAGRHGKGAAQDALRYYGAKWGKGVGRQGDAYAIPTKDANLRVLGLPSIRRYVYQFLRYATRHPELIFDVTAIGTGYAGYAAWEIAPLFNAAPSNVRLPESFKEVMK